jgi:hypothetical protein
MAHTGSAATEPPRTDVIPGSYAINVTDDVIHAWVYRVSASAQDGTWTHLETLDRDDDPRLSLTYARPPSPAEGGYWIYSRSYDCELDCA